MKIDLLPDVLSGKESRTGDGRAGGGGGSSFFLLKFHCDYYFIYN